MKRQGIIVSFAWTSDAFESGSKTETRRFWKPHYAVRFKPGQICQGWTYCPRVKGARFMHHFRVLKQPYREMLGDMTQESFLAEGGTRYWNDLNEFIEMMGGPCAEPYVLTFEHVWELPQEEK